MQDKRVSGLEGKLNCQKNAKKRQNPSENRCRREGGETGEKIWVELNWWEFIVSMFVIKREIIERTF